MHTRMRPRIPRTILKMLSADLLRLVVVSASVLVSIVAFSTAVKPLAEGTLTAGQALSFMALAAPPMLQYALPFAAGFAATLAYHRFASDNEANAAYAGGIGHRTLLLPALSVGALLLIVMLVLQHSLIPRLLRQMEELVTRDIAQLLVNAVERGDSLRIQDAIIHADTADRLGPDPVSGARERLLLEGVLAISPNPAGGLSWEATAQRAVVWLFDGEVGPGAAGAAGASGTLLSSTSGVPDATTEGAQRGASTTTVVLQLINQSIVREGQGSSQTAGDVYRFAVPGAFRDKPKFYDWKGLRELRRNPDSVTGVDRQKRELAQALAIDETRRAIRLSIEGDGVLPLVDPEGQWARLTAGGLRWDESRSRYELLPPRGEGGVEVLWRLEDGRARIQRAERAWIRVEESRGVAGVPTITLDLEGVATREPGSASASAPGETVRTRLELRDLGLAGADLASLFRLGSDGLLAKADSRVGLGAAPNSADAATVEDIRSRAKSLRKRVLTAKNEALALMHERVAMSFACLVMLMAGAVAALRLHEARPLLVYLRSFFPSLATVIAISSGQNVATERGPVGLALLWGALLILGVFTLVEYVRLARR